MKNSYHLKEDGFEARWFEGTSHKEKAIILDARIWDENFDLCGQETDRCYSPWGILAFKADAV